MSRVRLRHRFEHAGVSGAQGLAGLLPARVRDTFGSSLGALTSDLLRVRRDVVDANLSIAFPELDEPRRADIARASYRHLGQEGLAMLALGAYAPEQIRARTPITGWDELQAALGRGRGVVMVTGHFGNWEMAAASLAVRGVPIDGVVQRQRNPLVDRRIHGIREALGLRIIDRRHAPRRVLRSLAEGRVVGFVADQDARRHGVFVPFFGTPASTHRGAALFAIRSGAPLFLGVAVRRRDGRYDCRTREIVVDRSGPLDQAVLRLTAAFTSALEAEIREAPEQYFWMHRRWKTRPRAGDPGNPPDGVV